MSSVEEGNSLPHFRYGHSIDRKSYIDAISMATMPIELIIYMARAKNAEHHCTDEHTQHHSSCYNRSGVILTTF